MAKLLETKPLTAREQPPKVGGGGRGVPAPRRGAGQTSVQEEKRKFDVKTLATYCKDKERCRDWSRRTRRVECLQLQLIRKREGGKKHLFHYKSVAGLLLGWGIIRAPDPHQGTNARQQLRGDAADNGGAGGGPGMARSLFKDARGGRKKHIQRKLGR